jgi:hypothetical protein
MTAELESEITRTRRTISADTISMSVSELTSLYKEGSLIIRPEFQRLYRWTVEQKSRLVESILLGIPLPSLFVAQSFSSGRWELVDGLQRVSTLLELQGLLPTEDGNGMRPPLGLTGTRLLPPLEKHCWEERRGFEVLSDAQRLDVRLSRLDLKVIKRASDEDTKYDLFQRLNSFGSQLTPQEIRSAMIAGTSSATLSWLLSLTRLDAFKSTVALSERLVEEQYDLELVLRFLMLHNRSIGSTGGALADFSTRLDEWSLQLARTLEERQHALEHAFRTTFESLAETGTENVFRKWDVLRQRFVGAFLNTSYEVIALGVGFHVANGTPHRTDYERAAKELWQLSNMNARFATGLATQDRFVKTIPLGRKLMANPPEEVSESDLL